MAGPIPQTGNTYFASTAVNGTPPYSSNITSAIKAIPNPIDADTARDLLRQHLNFARNIVNNTPSNWTSDVLSVFGGLSTSDVINQARDGLNTVEGDLSVIDEWRGGTFPSGSPEYEFVAREIGSIYGAISALSDQVAVINVAVKQLPNDIADNAKTALKWGVPVAAVVGIIVVLYLLKK